MMKIYLVNGFTRQFEEGTQPEGAVEVKTESPENKAAAASTKAKKPANKARKAVTK